MTLYDLRLHRTVVQVAVAAAENQSALVALADDGSLWIVRSLNPSGMQWEQIPLLPPKARGRAMKPAKCAYCNCLEKSHVGADKLCPIQATPPVRTRFTPMEVVR